MPAEKSSGLQLLRGICCRSHLGKFSVVFSAKPDRLAGLCPALASEKAHLEVVEDKEEAAARATTEN